MSPHRYLLIPACIGLLLFTGATSSLGQQLSCNGKAATVSGRSGTDGDDVIVGTSRGEWISGGAGNDTICSAGGDDSIDGGDGDDYIDGGDGRDALSYPDYEGPAVNLNLLTGIATVGDDTDTIVVGTIEDAFRNCSSATSDVLIGDHEANTFSGGSGSDRLEGMGGDDLLIGTDPSYGYTDAICWGFFGPPDTDVLIGGEGDDTLLGQDDTNELDGGAGFDYLHGGEGGSCTNGERHAGCGSPPPADATPACSDGVDNDNDGAVDFAGDVGCAVPTNPTEDEIDDPKCNDGFDNDGDGKVDFPGDSGCGRLGWELEAPPCHPCPYELLTIDLRVTRGLLTGSLSLVAITPESSTASGRRIAINLIQPEGSSTLARTVTTGEGAWKIKDFRIDRGTIFAVARGEGDCSKIRSELIPVRTVK